MRKIRALIVDDEADVAQALNLILKETCPDVEIVRMCHSVHDASEILNKREIDLLFLDIQMPGGTGFDLLELMNIRVPCVIFTTGYSEFAIRALRSGAVDYLLKPIDPDELVKAVARVKAALDKNEKAPFLLAVHTTKGLCMLNKDDVMYIKADGRYSELHCVNAKTYLVCKNIGEYEAELQDKFFFRAHKSYLVNRSHVCAVKSAEKDFIELSDKQLIELSKRKKAEFLEFLKNE